MPPDYENYVEHDRGCAGEDAEDRDQCKRRQDQRTDAQPVTLRVDGELVLLFLARTPAT